MQELEAQVWLYLNLIYEKNYADEKYLVENLNLDLSRPIIILTQHPVTTEYNKARQQIKETLKAIAIIAKMNVQIIVIRLSQQRQRFFF